MRNIVLGLPAYNEEENIEVLIETALMQMPYLKTVGFDLKILALDDKSTDSTKQLILNIGAFHENVIPLLHEKNKNLGGGLNTLIAYFLQNYSTEDLLVIMDADNTQSPIYIKDMIQKMAEGFDIVIASRYQKGSKVMGVPFMRIIYSYLARFYYSLVLGIPGARDYTCGYRMYDYAILHKGKEKYKDHLIENSSFACMTEILYKLSRVGGKVAEIPFTLRYDQKGGNSSMNVLKTIKDSITTALNLRFK